MSSNRKIILSHDVFSGYTENVELDYFNTIEELCIYITNCLLITLKSHNLEILYNKAKNLNLHNHSHKDIQDILMNTKTNDIIYLCDHNCF